MDIDKKSIRKQRKLIALASIGNFPFHFVYIQKLLVRLEFETEDCKAMSN